MPREEGVEDEILQARVLLVGFGDAIKKACADDAAAAPDAGDVFEVEIPPIEFAAFAELHHALGIANDLAGIEGVAHGIDERGAVAGVGLCVRAFEHSACGNALVLQRAEDRDLDSSADDGERDAHFDGMADGPFPGALLPGSIEDEIDNRTSGLRVDREKIRAVISMRKLSSSPLFHSPKICANSLALGLSAALRNGVGLADELHVAVFDAVVRHFHVVTRAIGPHVAAAWLALGDGGDLCVDRRDGLPSLPSSPPA